MVVGAVIVWGTIASGSYAVINGISRLGYENSATALREQQKTVPPYETGKSVYLVSALIGLVPFALLSDEGEDACDASEHI